MPEQQEKYLDLPGGRILAYADAGNPNSKIIVLFFHGACSVGDATNPSPALLKRDVHYIAPTLPGWGNSSPRTDPAKNPYHIALAQDITALLEHLHPGCGSAPAGEYKLYISGGSYGTAPTQMIFNASEEIFPLTRHIAACLLLAPFSPFKHHADYAKDLTWDNYLSVGPPSRFVPWHIVQRLGSVVVGKKLKNVDDAEVFLRGLIFDHIKEDEKVSFEKWRKERGLKEGEIERNMASCMVRSVAKHWDGFMEIADVLHSDWGFNLENIQGKPVVIVASAGDRMTPATWARWLVEKYPSATLKELTGGHIAGLWSIDSIWEEFLGAGT